MFRILHFSLCLILSSALIAETVDFSTHVPIYQNGSSTFYVSARINNEITTEFVIDTGSGYAAINPTTLKALKKVGEIAFVKEIRAIMANGKEVVVPVYKLTSINIGNNCLIHDVEAAILPGSRRNILGLSALRKTAPFAIDTFPSTLLLSNCNN